MNFKVLAAAILAATVAEAQETEMRLPSSWQFVGFQPAYGVCDAGIDEKLAAAGTNNVTIICQPNEGGVVVVSNSFDAVPYRGQRVRFSGDIKTEGVGGEGVPNELDVGGRLVLRLDRGTAVGANVVPILIGERPQAGFAGSNDWARVELVADVTSDASAITIGVDMRGFGQVWLRNVEFEPVGLDVPVNVGPRSLGPMNLELE